MQATIASSVGAERGLERGRVPAAKLMHRERRAGFSAAASAFASSAIVRLQLQTLGVLPSRLIGLRLFGGLLRMATSSFGSFAEHELRGLVERGQQLRRNRVSSV